MADKKAYTHLHVHSTFSLLDGISRRSDLIAKAKELGMSALAMTEHGNMHNAISFYKGCLDASITPIIGCEMYISPDSMAGRSYAKKGEAEEDSKNGDLTYYAYHLTVLAKNRDGYNSLKKLNTLSYREGFYRKPRIDDEALAANKEGLIVLSGCLASKVSRLIVAGHKDKALEEVDRMRKTFGESFFLEVMAHNIEEENVVRNALIEFGNQHGIGLVLTGDSHFTNHGDELAHEVALGIGINKTLSNPDRWKFNGDGYWFKSQEEMHEIARNASIPHSALDNTINITNSIEDYGFQLVSKTKKLIIPQFKDDVGNVLDNDTCDQLIELKAFGGLAERKLSDKPEYVARLTEELEMIKKKKFSSYFLIISDIVDFMRKNNIMPGVGRGSAGGSLVCYSLFITGIDPVKWGASFSRFINEGRKDLPDIDTDISQERRGEILDYIVAKYGKDRVAQIVTFQTMGAKAAIDNVGRILDVPSVTRRQIGKMVGELSKDDHLTDVLHDNIPVKNMLSQVPNWIDVSLRLEGNNKNLSAHAAGVVISNDDITNHVPLLRDSKEGYLVTQYDMADLGELGLLKLDMLGLKTLDLIQGSIELIKERNGVYIDFQNMSLDDADTYTTIANGKYVSIFQYDSNGIRNAAKQLRPDKFEHLVALNALYRPGPLEPGSGLHGKSILENYIDRRHGREEIESWHKDLNGVFDRTLGLCVYQDEDITLYNGKTKKIKDIDIGDEVLSIGSTKNRVSNKVKSGRKEVFKISTAYGGSVSLTADHVIMVNGKETKACDVVVGDYLHKPYTRLEDGTSSMSINQAYCIGLLLGDGALTSSTPIMCLGNDEIWRQQCNKIFRETFNDIDPIEYHCTRSYYLRLRMSDRAHGGHSKNSVNTLLSYIGLKDVSCKNKFIPDVLLKSNDSIRAAVVAGLWDSDGSVANAIHFTSTSSRLRNDVRSILDHFHISSYTSGVRVFIRDVQKFMSIIKLRHHNKTVPKKKNGLGLKYHQSHLIDLYNSRNSTQDAFLRQYNISSSCLGHILSGRHKYISSVTIGHISNGDIYDMYYGMHNSDRVVSIEPLGVQTVYDLSMEDTTRPWFTAGGILVHNCVYQEDVMNTAKIFAGFSDAEADEYRAAIGKKDKVKFDAAQQKFIDHAIKHGRTDSEARDVTTKLAGFARYGWNVSHSLCYSYLSYATAYLETHFPHEYYTVLLNLNQDKSDKIKPILSSIMQRGIKIKPPHINYSHKNYITNGKVIYMGIQTIRMIGAVAVEPILNERKLNGEYKSYIDFCIRMNLHGRVNKSVKENLIKSGAFDWDTSMNVKNKLFHTELIQNICRKFYDKLPYDELYAYIVEHTPQLPDDINAAERLAMEKSSLNFYITSHPVVQFYPILNMFDMHDFITPAQVSGTDIGTRAILIGLVEEKEMKMTKNNKPYLNLRISDNFDTIYVKIWSPLATMLDNTFTEGQLVFINCTVKEDKLRPDENQVYVHSLIPIVNQNGGIPVEEFIANTVVDGNVASTILNVPVATYSEKIMNLGHVFTLKNTGYIRPEAFSELQSLKNKVHFSLKFGGR